MNDLLKDKIIVGSEEWCALPELGIPAVKARVDSGAKTSSLHAFNIRAFKRGGISWVSYELHPIQHNRKVIVRCESQVVDRRMVKSSSGVAEKRYVIKTQLELSGQSWEIEVTLANRDSMGYRMLLGRAAMLGRILVDPSAKQLCGTLSKDKSERLYGQSSHGIQGLKIGLLASNPRLYSNRRIIEAAEERGHEIQFIDIKQCYMKLDADNPELHFGRGQTLNDLDAVIPRIKSEIGMFGCALLRQFENVGIFALNSSAAISSTRNKLLAIQTLLDHGVSLPPSAAANSPMDIPDLTDMVEGFPLVIKPAQGYKGDGVMLAESASDADSIISAFKSANANLLIQKFIKEAGGMDIRVLVVDGKAVSAVESNSTRDPSGANLLRGSTTAPAKLSSQERRLAVKAAKAMGLKVAGIDMIRSNDGPLVLDIHASPNLRYVENASGKDLAGMLIHAVEKKLKWKRPLTSQGGNSK